MKKIAVAVIFFSLLMLAAAFTDILATDNLYIFGQSFTLRLVPEDWDFQPSQGTRNASVEWKRSEPGGVTLSISQGGGGQAYLISRKLLEGDFDAQVGVYLVDWQPPRGAVTRVMAAAARPDEKLEFRLLNYILVREALWTKPYPEDTFSGWLVKADHFSFLQKQVAEPRENFFKLRLSRRQGILTAYRLRGIPNPAGFPIGPANANRTDWVEVAHFDTTSGEPLLLILGVSNRESRISTVFPSIKVAFTELYVQAERVGLKTEKDSNL